MQAARIVADGRGGLARFLVLYAALYGTFGLGLAGVLATLLSGALYVALGARAFWAMALLSLAALPLVPGPRSPNRHAPSTGGHCPRVYGTEPERTSPSTGPCPTSPRS